VSGFATHDLSRADVLFRDEAKRDSHADVQDPGFRHSRATPFTAMIARRAPGRSSRAPAIPTSR
jgi:hypothetical protein